jgi:hypothetical protein
MVVIIRSVDLFSSSSVRVVKFQSIYTEIDRLIFPEVICRFDKRGVDSFPMRCRSVGYGMAIPMPSRMPPDTPNTAVDHMMLWSAFTMTLATPSRCTSMRAISTAGEGGNWHTVCT